MKIGAGECKTRANLFSANFDFGQCDFGKLAEVELAEVECPRLAIGDLS